MIELIVYPILILKFKALRRTYFLDCHDGDYRDLRSRERRAKTCEQWRSSRDVRSGAHRTFYWPCLDHR